MRTSRIMAFLCLSLILGLAAITAANAGLFDIFKAPKKSGGAAAGLKQSLVVFPFDHDSTLANVPETFGAEIGSYLRTVLVGSPKYSVYLFSDRLSSIQRGASDTTFKTEELKAPFAGDDRAKALRLARELAADFYLVGVIDSYVYDPAQKVAQITLTAELFDGKTGKSVGKYMVAGKADASSKASDEDEYRAVAAGKAVDSLKEQVLPSTAKTKPGEKQAAEAKPAEVPAAPTPAPASVPAPEAPAAPAAK